MQHPSYCNRGCSKPVICDLISIQDLIENLEATLEEELAAVEHAANNK